MTRDEMLADLSYARALAEEGRHAPLLGGAYLLLWGVLSTIAFIGQWTLLAGHAPLLNGAAFAILWGGFAALGVIGTILLARRTSKQPGLTSVSVRAEIAVWDGVRLALTAIAFGAIGRMMLTGDTEAPNIIFGAAFALYGAALFAVAVLSEQKWLHGFGALAIAIAFALCLFANEAWAYLIAAGGSLVVLAAPGVLLLKREPSALV